MGIGQPVEKSVFGYRAIHDIYDEIRDMYRRYPQPWVIGYSGGKDSTTVLQLVWNAIRELPPEERQKPNPDAKGRAFWRFGHILLQ